MSFLIIKQCDKPKDVTKAETYGFKINQKQYPNMKARTFTSTDWIEVHGRDFTYIAKVFLSDRGEAYMTTIQDKKKQFFKVDANLLKSGELQFFENVMKNSQKLSVNQAIDAGIT